MSTAPSTRPTENREVVLVLWHLCGMTSLWRVAPEKLHDKIAVPVLKPGRFKSLLFHRVMSDLRHPCSHLYMETPQ